MRFSIAPYTHPEVAKIARDILAQYPDHPCDEICVAMVNRFGDEFLTATGSQLFDIIHVVPGV